MSASGAGDNGRQLRPLLPAGTVTKPAVTTTRLRTARKPAAVAAACIPCRKQKTRCSGERPACARCIQRRMTCKYTTRPGETESQALRERFRSLQDRSAAHEEVFELLKNLPARDAEDVLLDIRSGADVVSIVRRFKTGDAMLQMAVSPETRFRYTLPYKDGMPEYMLGNNPYLDSIVYESGSLFANSPGKGSSCSSETNVSDRHISRLSPDQYQSLYLKPFHAAEVVEPRLSTARVSPWTTVCDDETLMRDLLANFFRCEYHFTAAFQKDLFLEDLAELREDFCSSLLVNVLLGYACVCFTKFSNRAEYWNPNTLLYRFIAEAKRLWELEAHEPRLTTVQAGIIFNVFHNLCGLDEIGQAYRLQSIALAHKMRLFDANVPRRSARVCHGMAFAAWALYNWETLVGFSFVFAPLLEEPPTWKLPEATEDVLWYGEIWTRYPLSHQLVPQYFGQVFRARSQFRVIMNEACQIAYSKDSEMTTDKAYGILQKLKKWCEGLPSPLQPRTIVLPGHLQLHLYYHHLILSIYEPLVGIKTGPGPPPEQVVAEAQRSLQTLIRIYYLRHGYEAMDLFIVIPLMLAGSECLDAIDAQAPGPELEALRSTLLLVAKGLYEQRRNHHLAEALYRVIVGRMRPVDAALMRDTMDLEDGETPEKRRMMQAVRSHWPVSVVKKKEDMESHILSNLVASYAHLGVEESPDGISPMEEGSGSG